MAVEKTDCTTLIARSACGLLVLMLLASFFVKHDHLIGLGGKTGWLMQPDGQFHVSHQDVHAGLICWRSVAVLNLLVLGACAFYWKRIWPRQALPPLPPRPALSRHVLTLTLILVVAAVVRQININQSLWYDELYSLVHFVFRTPLGVLTTYSAPNNHIGYTLLARLAIDPAQVTEVGFRIPSLVFGLVGVVAVYFLGLQLAGRTIALLAGAVMALHPWATSAAQEARGYSAMMALTALSTALLIRALDLKRNGSWLGVIVCNVTVAFIHPFSMFVIWGQQISAYLATLARPQPKGDRTILMAQVTAVYLLTNALILQLYAFILPQMYHYIVNDGRLSANKPSLGEMFSDLLRLGNGTPGWNAGLGVPILLMILMGIAVLFKYRGLAWRGWLILLPVALSVAAPKLADTFTHTRFYAFVLPMGIVVALIGLESSARLLRLSIVRARWILIGGTIMWIGWMLPRLVEQSLFPCQPLRDAIELVMRERGGDDGLIATGTGVQELHAYYDGTLALREVERQPVLVKRKGIWLIAIYQSTLPDMINYAGRDFRLVERLKGTMTGADGGVLVYFEYDQPGMQ